MTAPPTPENVTAAQHIYEPVTTLTGTELRAVSQPKIKVRRKVEPAEGSRLSALMAELPRLEAEKADSEQKLKEHKKKVQAEIAAVLLDGEEVPDVFDIPADPYGSHPAYTLSAREGAWRIDTEAMKTQDPGTYVKWAKKGDDYWELRRVQKNRVKRG